MLDRSLWEVQPSETFIYNLDARTKLVMLGWIAVVAVLIDSPKSLLLLFWSSFFLHIIARSTLAQWGALILLLLLSMWGTMVSQALFYHHEPRTEIACLVSSTTPIIGTITKGVYLYREGLAYGAEQALRSGIMLSAGLLLCWNTDISKLMRVLVGWKMPYEIAFMLTTSLRFLPVVIGETAVVLTAQRLKGFNPLKSLSPQAMLETAFHTLLPILARILRRTEMLALSIESRGFGRQGHNSHMIVWPLQEKYGCLLVVFLLFFMIVVKLLSSLHYNGVAYFPVLSQVYNFAAVWM